MDERSDGGEKMEDIMLPGFRFHPTDEELVGFYLKRKIQQRPLTIELIKQIDIYKYDPWDLPKLAPSGEKEWYFFCPRDRKYRNSARPNRVTGAGFWKATGTDRPIYSSEGSKCIGLRKSLVFYRGRAAKGVKTDWMMHEFRLPSLNDPSAPKRFLDKTIPANDSWAICRIFKKTNTAAHRALSQSWMSPQPETRTSSHHDHDHNMSSFTTKTSFYGDHNNVQQSSSASFSPILDHSINNPLMAHHHHHYQSPNSTISNGLDLASTFMFSPLDPSPPPPPPRSSSSVVDDVSSMLLNMSSSVLGDFGGSFSSQDHDQGHNNGFSLLTSLIPNHHQHEMQSQGSDGSEEINNLNGVMLRNIHGDEEQWNIGFPLMNILSPHDAWKSSFVWDTPTEMSTTKCYI